MQPLQPPERPVAPDSQARSQLDDDADYQTAYQSARTITVKGGLG
jgi:hypothetical protein